MLSCASKNRALIAQNILQMSLFSSYFSNLAARQIPEAEQDLREARWVRYRLLLDVSASPVKRPANKIEILHRRKNANHSDGKKRFQAEYPANVFPENL